MPPPQAPEAFAQAIDRQIRVNEARLEYLRGLMPGSRITCEICGGHAPEPQHCGCGGTQTVEEAIRYLEMTIEILMK